MFSGPLQIVVVIAAIGYILARRLIGEPAQVKRMLVLPVVLGVIGVANVVKVEQALTSVVFLIILVVIDTTFGFLRGRSTRISDRGGMAYIHYTPATIVLWAAGLAANFGVEFLLRLVDHAAEEAAGHGLLLTLGSGILAEGAVVMAKVLRSGSSPDWTIRSGRGGTPPSAPSRETTAGTYAQAMPSLLGELRDSRDRRRTDRRRRR